MTNLELAFQYGKIAGAAETIEDEWRRDSLCATAVSLLEDLKWQEELNKEGWNETD